MKVIFAFLVVICVSLAVDDAKWEEFKVST